MTRRPTVAIVGAGMAGLSLAQRLAPYATVSVFEKSRGLGGRMATRRRPEGTFDHGAQYFTIRDAGFHAALEPAIEKGIVQAWSVPLMRTDAAGQAQRLEDRAPRFVAVPGMTALAKLMANRLTVHSDQKIAALDGRPGEWVLATPQTAHGPFDWVICTAPAPQTLDLLPLSEPDRAAVSTVRMSGCFTLMLRLPQDMALPFSASQVEHPLISWIAANHTKPDRDPSHALVIHANNQWSDMHLEDSPEAVRDLMLDALKRLFPTIAWDEILSVDLHRWRFASVEQPLGRPFILDPALKIGACGDWCLGNRVEAAFLSGQALAENLIARFQEDEA
jgi:renalase